MLATFLAVPLLEDGSELLTNSISLEPVGGVLETHLTYSTGLYVVNLLRPTGFPFYPEFQKFKNFMFFFFKKNPGISRPPTRKARSAWLGSRCRCRGMSRVWNRWPLSVRRGMEGGIRDWARLQVTPGTIIPRLAVAGGDVMRGSCAGCGGSGGDRTAVASSGPVNPRFDPLYTCKSENLSDCSAQGITQHKRLSCAASTDKFIHSGFHSW